MLSNKTDTFGDLVLVDLSLSVDVHGLVGVDADADLSDEGVDEPGRVAHLQVGQEAVHVDLGQEDKVPHADLEQVIKVRECP